MASWTEWERNSPRDYTAERSWSERVRGNGHARPARCNGNRMERKPGRSITSKLSAGKGSKRKGRK